MARQSVKELGRVLPERIRLLSSLIARKPQVRTTQWASTVDQAFTLYTRTSTINLLQSLNQALIELDWPFPGYVDLSAESDKIQRDFKSSHRGWIGKVEMLIRGPSLTLTVIGCSIANLKGKLGKVAKEKAEATTDWAMVWLFEQYQEQVFEALHKAKVLRSRNKIINDIEQAFKREMWAACITTTLPLLDSVVREYFEADRITATIQVIRNAFFDVAKLAPKDLMPGAAVWDGHARPEVGNTFAKSLEEDLRLPGIYLSSFFEFADRYYGWCKTTSSAARTPLNRHAIIHGSFESWTQPNAVRMLSFLDLTIRLEPALRVLIHGENAVRNFKRTAS